MNSRLRKLLLPLLKAVKEGKPIGFRMRSAASQGIFLIGKGIKKPSQGRLRRVSKRSTKNEETAKIRGACLERSNGWCECGCGRGIIPWRLEMDHFYGRRVPQCVENCWALASICHVAKTHNDPSAEEWNYRFEGHCGRYGYAFKPRIVHEPVRRAAP